jgi:hypothetical protein
LANQAGTLPGRFDDSNENCKFDTRAVNRARNRYAEADAFAERALPERQEKTNRKEIMKKLLLSVALAVAAPFAWAQVSETTTTTTTEGGGAITSFTPGNTIVLRESSGPRTYRFGKTVTYVTKSGRVLDEDTVRTRIKVGVPVHVHYVGEGDNMLVDRVILDED